MVAIPALPPQAISVLVGSAGTITITTSTCSDATETETQWINFPSGSTTHVQVGNFNEPEFHSELPSEWLPSLADICKFGIIYWELTEFAIEQPQPIYRPITFGLVKSKGRMEYPAGET
ncbi:hypothetical protein DRQ25_18250 [Candidatus Fermentibacteria bacterium]|nr:MAG: hypothetical protein DRQ25_18250 [Candidatus Fermentibacteria bacterium]